MGKAENLDDIKNAENLLNDTEEVVVEKTEVVAEKEEAVKPAETAPATEAKEEVIDEDLPQGTKSHIGRIVARQIKERTKPLETTLSKIEETLNFLKERNTVVQTEEPEPELPENPTAEEIRDFVKQDRERLLKNIEKQNAAKVNQEEAQKRNYATEYKKMIEETLDPDEDSEVYKLMTDTKDITYNQVYKWDAKEDFLINFRNATKSILNKTKTPIPSVVHGKAPKVPTGVNVPGATKVAVKQVDTSNWSSEEKQLAAMFNAEELAKMSI